MATKPKYNIYLDIWRLKCVEPIKRKHGSLRPEWQSHRFPIKNGITWREAMIRDLAQPSPFIGMIRIVDGH